MAENFVTRTFRQAMARLAGLHFAGDRDLYAVLGYPSAISIEQYWNVYERQDLAGRIVDAYPDATWREPPTVRQRDAEEGGAFEKAVEALAEPLQLWACMNRLDRLMNVGHYGVLVLGLDGGEPMNTPAVKGGRYRLLYATPHSERTAQITAWETDPRSPRFGLPTQYNVQAGTQWVGYGSGQRNLAVHWTRVIHAAERTGSDESIGTPRLRRVWNRLLDLDKLLGGSAEVYWQNAAALRAWIADKDAAFDEPARAAMAEELEELAHGLRRDVKLRGVTPHMLAADPADPSPHIDKQLDMIAGASGIPKRILIGSERGELSSEQDENNWAARVAERREQVATPKFVKAFVDRMVYLGILADPGAYDVVWPESDTLGEEARARIAETKSRAVATYAGTPGADAYIAPQEFRRWLGEDEESEFELADDVDAAAAPADAALENDPEAAAEFEANRRLVTNATARTLYVRRDVENWRDIDRWARAQGFSKTVGAAMHVTIAFSRQPVDWMRVREAGWTPGTDADRGAGRLKIAPGGPRIVEPLGPKGAVVLFFAASELSWRHREILDCGASWDFPDYQPHITISYAAGTAELAELEPYRGPIVLGPEIFEEVDEEWIDRVSEE